MVSFWPWKAADASPASFEKALAGLAAKIADTQVSLDRTRSTSRRARVLSTLYLSFAYLVYAIVLVLVVGYRNLGALEWSSIAGGPLAIYTVRTVLDGYFNFRIETLAAKLKEYQVEREKTIQKLKAATKYDSTLELLEKYGGAENRQVSDKGGKGKTRTAGDGDDGGQGGQGGRRTRGGPSSSARTGIPPPPTANIARGPHHGLSLAPSHDAADAAADLDVSAEFAPNAFGPEAEEQLLLMQQLGSSASRPATAASATTTTPAAPAAVAPMAAMPLPSHWYDRILDLLMGEDETAAKNRIVLVCSRCRLVNGQAPPGTRSLTEIGSWRCMGCGALNGEVAEAKQLINDVLEEQHRHQPRRAAGRAATVPDSNSELDQEQEEDEDVDNATDSSADRKASASTTQQTVKRRTRKHA